MGNETTIKYVLSYRRYGQVVEHSRWDTEARAKFAKELLEDEMLALPVYIDKVTKERIV